MIFSLSVNKLNKLVASTTSRYVRYEDMNQWTKHPPQAIEHLLKWVSVTVPACQCANVAVLMTSSCLQPLKYSHKPPADLVDVGEEVW